nr:MAG TPA: hypothetical protein [Caudoviricetes sp.]
MGEACELHCVVTPRGRATLQSRHSRPQFRAVVPHLAHPSTGLIV